VVNAVGDKSSTNGAQHFDYGYLCLSVFGRSDAFRAPRERKSLPVMQSQPGPYATIPNNGWPFRPRSPGANRV
jgi:hypothetical protein